MVDLRCGEVVREELVLREAAGDGDVHPVAGARQEPESTAPVTVLDGLVVRVATLVVARGRRVAVRVPARKAADPAYLDLLDRAIAQSHVPAAGLALAVELYPEIDPADVAATVGDRAEVLIRFDVRSLRDPAWSRVSRAVVTDLVAFARERELKLVVGGISDERTFEVLRRLRVDLGTGPHLGEPVALLPDLLRPQAV